MNKTAIKNYASWARVQLIESAKQRAFEYEITENGENKANVDSIGGRLLSVDEKEQRKQLIAQIQRKGYSQVMEEAAYTWFNRFIALRFMEVNGYLPSKIRVFTDENGAFKPEILKEAMSVELDGLDRNKVLNLLDKQDNEALYKYLLITQCNALNTGLPYMFEKIANWSELLFPANLLRSDSVVARMVTDISEEDWTDQVQIIGWLYQYYNAEPKDKVFADLKKNVKISKENIPAATQLFTPDWIVRYMVENSLGRLWVEGHPNDELKANWKYYLEEAEQEPEVQAQLAEIRKEYAALKPEDIKVIDPCMGSGHILIYMFDVLVQIYESYGYNAREAAGLILQNNLYGLDIDDRAAQLAYFAVMMKARQYDRRIFSRGIQPHVHAVVESNSISRDVLEYFVNGDSRLKKSIESIIKEMHDAKEYGSILNITMVDFAALKNRIDEIEDDISMFAIPAIAEIKPLVCVAEMLAQKYHAVVTNPPYMSSKGMSDKLSSFVQNKYPDSKTDLFSVFIERCSQFALRNCCWAMITMHNWMFIDSFLELRRKLIQTNTTVSLAHLGIKAFEFIGNDIVQTCAFCCLNGHMGNYTSKFVRLTEVKNYEEKQTAFFDPQYHFKAQANMFLRVPTIPYAYWVEKSFFDNYSIGKELAVFGELTGSKNITGNNDKYLRQFWEVEQENIQKGYWVPYAKGGFFRKYYGNITYVVDWRAHARSYYEKNKTSNLLNEDYWYREGITYSAVTSRGTGFRYFPKDCLFDYGGPVINISKRYLYQLLGFYNSKVASYYFGVLNPSVNLQTKDLRSVPYIIPSDDNLVNLVCDQIELAKSDWADDETTFEFKCNPLVSIAESEQCSISRAVERYHEVIRERFVRFERNELEINRVFMDAYKLNLPIEFERRDISIRDENIKDECKALISYAVGCMFGRYSLDCEGLAYAGGEWDSSKYQTFEADSDNIIPICDDDYFDDDITGRFIKWVETVYGKNTLEENLKFIADALGGKGTPREVIRSYFLNDFYADHLKIYQKRPIYWLFDSGKKNGFKALIYMHRYQPDLLARMRTDYVHEQQERYRTQLQMLEDSVQSASPSERVKLNKQITKLKDQALEVQQYEEKIHHLADQMISIDLDDGVKVNYAKFQDVLEKIK